MLYRVFGFVGVLSLVVVWVCIVAAIVLAGCFDWSMHALSDLGDWVAACSGDKTCLESCSRASEPVFNYGLIVSGLLFTIASIALGLKHGSYTWVLVITGLSLSMIGVLPEGARPYHFITAAVFFLSLPAVALTAWRIEAGVDETFSKTSLALGLASLAGVALFFIVKTDIIGGIGLAVPEVIAAIPSSLWAGYTFYKKLLLIQH